MFVLAQQLLLQFLVVNLISVYVLLMLCDPEFGFFDDGFHDFVILLHLGTDVLLHGIGIFEQ